MRLKTIYIFLVLASLAMISCRETEELVSYGSSKNVNKGQLKIPKINYDSISNESTNNSEDPPKTGTNWRIK